MARKKYLEVIVHFKSLASSSAGNAYLVEESGIAPLLIDPGIGFSVFSRALGYGVSGLAGCLISHQHGDHSKGAAELARRGVPIYTSRECAEALGIDVFHVEHGELFTTGGWRITAWDAVHDVRCFGFIIDSPAGDRLLFCTDSRHIPYRFDGLTHIAIGVNYEESIMAGRVESGRMDAALSARVKSAHMSLDSALEFFKANELSSLREVHLLHLSASNSNEAEFKKSVQRAVGVPVFIADVR